MRKWQIFFRPSAARVVQGAYRGILKRDPDSAGLASYTRHLIHSRDIEGFLDELAHSDEFWEKIFAERSGEIVRAAFIGLLSRDPDQDSLAPYSDSLANSGDLASIIKDIAGSEECHHRFFAALAPELTRGMFAGLLGRDPEREALETYSESLASSKNLAPIIEDLVNSREFHDKFFARFVPELVRGAFNGLLGRDPEPEILGPYSTSLASAVYLAPIIADIAGSDEFHDKFIAGYAPELVRGAFNALLGRDPEPEPLESCSSTMSQKGGFAKGLADMINSEEFRKRFFETVIVRDLIKGMHRALVGTDPDSGTLEKCIGIYTETGDLGLIITELIGAEDFWNQLVSSPHPDPANTGSFNWPQSHSPQVETASAPAPWEMTIARCASEFVAAAYNVLLGRPPDPAGLRIYTDLIEKGGWQNISASLSEVLSTLLMSDEFAGLQVKRKRWPNPAESYDEPSLIFLHIEKTAGTSIQNHLGGCFGRKVFKEHGNSLHLHCPGELSRYSVFAGHFNYDSLRYIPKKNISIFTFVREPKERLLSLYYFWHAHEPRHPSFHSGMAKANQGSIEDFFEDPELTKYPAVWNHMVWTAMGEEQWLEWQSALAPSNGDSETSEMIERIIRPAIVKRLEEFIFIGLQEDFDRSVDMLFHILEKEPPAKKRVDHTLDVLMSTEPHFKKFVERRPITTRLDAALDRMVQLDNVLYEEAKFLFLKQLAETDVKSTLSTAFSLPLSGQYPENEQRDRA